MNKKIVFGIILFCAISFLAYTFANPAEEKLDNNSGTNGTVVGGEGNSGNNQDNLDKKENENSSVDETNNENEIKEDNNNQPETTTNQTNSISTTVRRPSSAASSSNTVASTTRPTTRPSTSTPAVTNPVIEPTGIEISTSSNSGSLTPGGTMNIEANILPNDATNKTVTYKSSNPSVATVDGNGLVTAVHSGTATITVLTSNGVQKDITVKVLGNESSALVVKTADPSSTSITNYRQDGTTLYIYGTVDKSDIYSATVSIKVPEIYTLNMLPNLSASIGQNMLNVPQYNYKGTKIIKNPESIGAGNAYINVKIDFTGRTINSKNEKVTILVNWLGAEEPITYYLDFSGVIVK